MYHAAADARVYTSHRAVVVTTPLGSRGVWPRGIHGTKKRKRGLNIALLDFSRAVPGIDIFKQMHLWGAPSDADVTETSAKMFATVSSAGVRDCSRRQVISSRLPRQLHDRRTQGRKRILLFLGDTLPTQDRHVLSSPSVPRRSGRKSSILFSSTASSFTLFFAPVGFTIRPAPPVKRDIVKN